MGEAIRMKMADGAEVAVYQALAVGERRGGVVLLHEVFGVTDHIRELAAEYAAEGYDVLAPSLFDREHPGFESDYSGPQYNRAGVLARELHPFELSVADARTCAEALKGADGAGGPVFAIGFCYGGSVAWRLAQTSDVLDAASCYYGSKVPTDWLDQAPRCATIAHFGRFDSFIAMEDVDKLIACGHPTAQVFVYETGHGFNSDRRKDYHPESAELAHQRTMMLFRAVGG